MAQGRYRLGIDIGGTFTDLSVLDSQSGHRFGFKTPTVPQDPAQGVANGIALLAEHGVRPQDIEYFVHGTTIAVNAIIQRSGAHVALLVTEGFRDVLEIGRLRLPIPFSFYSQRVAPLLPREVVLPVHERIRHAGTVETPLTDAEIERVVDAVAALEVEGVAICLLHSYANPQHELALKDALIRHEPHLFVSCSAEIWPQMREYERALVTVMNAYVRPALSRYLDNLERMLDAIGVQVRPYLTGSNGGILTTTAAKERPVLTLLSGPASGVIGAVGVAAPAGFLDLITFDMGGTSADIAVVEDGHVAYSREERIGDFPVILPAVGISSIGAGGGSIAWLDGADVLKVGPQSAGADPGPACYTAGGTEPTLSDAFLLCGYLNPARFAGKTRLDEGAACAAMSKLAGPLGLSVPETASAVVQVALANMYAEFSSVLERKGLDPRDFTLVAFGGAGPVVACLLAEEVNIRRVLVPPSPGTLSALGALKADVMSDFIRTVHWRLDQPIGPSMRTAVGELARMATTWLEQEAPTVARAELQWSADMRYVGQSYEVEVPLAEAWLRDGDPPPMADAFHAAHRRIFYHADPAALVELINLHVRAVAQMPKPPEWQLAAASATGPELTDTRVINCKGVWQEARVYQREGLGLEKRISGPAVVEQSDSTTVIPPGWQAIVEPHGNLVIEQELGT